MPVPSNEVTMGRQLETVENFELALIAAGGDDDLFTITGGPIYVEELTGIVTTLIGASGTIITHLQQVTLAGAAPGGVVDMCLAAGGLDIDAAAIDSQITITGAVGDAAVVTVTGVVVAPGFLTNHIILAPGTIQLHLVDTGAMSDIVGAITWTMVYRPLVPGVSVVAVP